MMITTMKKLFSNRKQKQNNLHQIHSDYAVVCLHVSVEYDKVWGVLQKSLDRVVDGNKLLNSP